MSKTILYARVSTTDQTIDHPGRTGPRRWVQD